MNIELFSEWLIVDKQDCHNLFADAFLLYRSRHALNDCAILGCVKIDELLVVEKSEFWCKMGVH